MYWLFRMIIKYETHDSKIIRPLSQWIREMFEQRDNDSGNYMDSLFNVLLISSLIHGKLFRLLTVLNKENLIKKSDLYKLHWELVLRTVSNLIHWYSPYIRLLI